MERNVNIIGADMSSSVHVDNKYKDILILGEWRTQGLDDTSLTGEANYPVNFTQPNKGFVLSLFYNACNISYLLMIQTYISSKQKNSEIRYTTLCLGNILQYFANDNLKKIGWGVVKFFLLILILLILTIF